MIENWKTAHHVVTARGGRFFAVLQPVLYIGDPIRSHLEISLSSGHARDFLTVYPLIQQRIVDLELDWVLDLTDVLDGDEPNYIDFFHVSEKGEQLIAQRLAETIRP